MIYVHIIHAFTKSGKGGNPAGIVLNSEELSKTVMKNIAKEVGLSETAFVQKSKIADYKVRFFTPEEEVDLCGHATIAVFYLLRHKKTIKSGRYTQETKAGIINLEVTKNNTIFMTQKLPKFYDKLKKKEIADSLNISTDLISDKLPIQIVSTGLRDILVPIESLKSLHKIKPNFDKVSKISKKHNVVGYHLFSLETKFNSTAHCRNFAPLHGIPEESATGTSNGALSCYLFKHEVLPTNKIKNLVLEQGYSMNLPSEIIVNLKLQKDKISEVKVGGTASYIKKIKVTV